MRRLLSSVTVNRFSYSTSITPPKNNENSISINTKQLKQIQFVSQVQTLHAMKQFEILVRKLSIEYRDREKVKLAQSISSISIFHRPELIRKSLELSQQFFKLDSVLPRLEYFTKEYPNLLLQPLIQIYSAKQQYEKLTTFYKNNPKLFNFKQNRMIFLLLQNAYVQLGDCEQVVKMLDTLTQEYNVKPTIDFYRNVIRCYLLQGKTEKAMSYASAHFSSFPIPIIEIFVQDYCYKRDLSQALQFLEAQKTEPSRWSTFIFQSMLHCAAVTKNPQQFEKFFSYLQQQPPTFRKLLRQIKLLIVKLAVTCNDPYILKQYQNYFGEIDSTTMNMMVNAFEKLNLVGGDELLKAVTLNGSNICYDLLYALLQMKKYSVAVNLFEVLKQTRQLGHKEYSLMLKYYSRRNNAMFMDLLREMEGKMLLTSEDLDYVLQICVQQGLFTFGETVFSMYDRLHRRRNVVTYLHILALAIKAKDKIMANKYVDLMRKENISLNESILDLMEQIKTLI